MVSPRIAMSIKKTINIYKNLIKIVIHPHSTLHNAFFSRHAVISVPAALQPAPGRSRRGAPLSVRLRRRRLLAAAVPGLRRWRHRGRLRDHQQLRLLRAVRRSGRAGPLHAPLLQHLRPARQPGGDDGRPHAGVPPPAAAPRRRQRLQRVRRPGGGHAAGGIPRCAQAPAPPPRPAPRGWPRLPASAQAAAVQAAGRPPA